MSDDTNTTSKTVSGLRGGGWNAVSHYPEGLAYLDVPVGDTDSLIDLPEISDDDIEWHELEQP